MERRLRLIISPINVRHIIQQMVQLLHLHQQSVGEFDMPTGNTVIAFVIINDHEQSSTVVKRIIMLKQRIHIHTARLKAS
ncbi:MAG: hypothetical protein ACLS9K_15895 [Lachnospira eligens]